MNIGQPCFLTIWLVVGMINISAYVLLWALVPTLYYLSMSFDGDESVFREERVLRKFFDGTGNFYISGVVDQTGSFLPFLDKNPSIVEHKENF